MSPYEIETLKFAAKAIGFGDPREGRVCVTGSEYPKGSGKKGALWNYVGYMDTAELWNPYSSDADLYQLAIKLRMFGSNLLYETAIKHIIDGLSYEEAYKQSIINLAADYGRHMERE